MKNEEDVFHPAIHLLSNGSVYVPEYVLKEFHCHPNWVRGNMQLRVWPNTMKHTVKSMCSLQPQYLNVTKA